MNHVLLAALFALATLSACSSKRDPSPAVPPTDPPPAPVLASQAKLHRVEVRYWIVSLGAATPLPVTPPRIRIIYQGVRLQATLVVPQPSEVVWDVRDVAPRVQVVALPSLTTYPGVVRPLITTEITLAELPPLGSLGYVVDLVVDGTTTTTRYTVEEAQRLGTPLSSTGSVAVLH